MQFLYLYLLSVPLFIIFDIFWLGFAAKNVYRKRLLPLLKPTNWVAAACFYLIFAFGLTFFAIAPATAAGSPWYAVILGGLYGLCTYGTYDLVNQSTLKGWPLFVTCLDIAWGVVASGLVSFLVFSIF